MPLLRTRSIGRDLHRPPAQFARRNPSNATFPPRTQPSYPTTHGIPARSQRQTPQRNAAPRSEPFEGPVAGAAGGKRATWGSVPVLGPQVVGWRPCGLQARWCAGDADVVEDARGDVAVLDQRDELTSPTAAGTLENVHGKRYLEQLSPGRSPPLFLLARLPTGCLLSLQAGVRRDRPGLMDPRGCRAPDPMLVCNPGAAARSRGCRPKRGPT